MQSLRKLYRLYHIWMCLSLSLTQANSHHIQITIIMQIRTSSLPSKFKMDGCFLWWWIIFLLLVATEELYRSWLFCRFLLPVASCVFCQQAWILIVPLPMLEKEHNQAFLITRGFGFLIVLNFHVTSKVILWEPFYYISTVSK